MVFSFFLHRKVHHCKSHGELNKNADPECSGCNQCEVLSIRCCNVQARATTSARAKRVVENFNFPISRPEGLRRPEGCKIRVCTVQEITFVAQ